MGLLAGGTAALTGLDYAIRRLYDGCDCADGLDRTTTADDVTLALHRYGAEGAPVLLVPGLGINYRHYDIAPGARLATTLRDDDYTAYTLDLRGMGASEDASGVRFDDYVEYDLPAAVRFVERRHGVMPHFIGHSMGGMLYFASSAYHDFSYQSGVALGAAFHGGSSAEPRQTGNYNKTTVETILPYLFRFAATVPAPEAHLARFGAVLQKSLMSVTPESAETFFVNMNNMHPITLKKAAVRTVEGPDRTLVEQFARWINTGRWTTMDGEFSYRENITSIEAPTRLIAAPLDGVAPLHNQKAGYDLLNGDHDLFVAERDAGCEHNYSHVDLICGRNVENEIYPQIIDWLDEHE